MNLHAAPDFQPFAIACGFERTGPACAVAASTTAGASGGTWATTRLVAAVFGLGVLAIGRPAFAASPPSVTATSNAPGWVTVAYAHSGNDGVVQFRLEQQGASTTLLSAQLADRFLVSSLQPATTYNFRVCAVYAGSAACSPWIPVRTMQGSRTPSPQAAPAIRSATSTVDSVSIAWGEVGDYRKLLVRVEDELGNSDQRDVQAVANRGFTFPGMRPGARYKLLVKGCGSPDHASCGPWSPGHWVTTRPAVGIRNGGGLCLDVHAPDMYRNGATVQGWTCNGTVQQRWTLNGQALLSGVGKCLDVHAPDMRRNGAKVQVWDCNGSLQQRWRLMGSTWVSGTGKCLDVHAPDMRNNGAKVQVWDCNQSMQQSWSWAP